MKEPDYSVTPEEDFVLVHMRRVMTHDDFDQMVDELLTTVDREKINRMLLWTDVRFEDVDPARRMEGSRVAESFGIFKRVAVCATDPQELRYLESSTSLLVMGGFVDPENFEHFSDIDSARVWIRQ